jgi:hypothetical protein
LIRVTYSNPVKARALVEATSLVCIEQVLKHSDRMLVHWMALATVGTIQVNDSRPTHEALQALFDWRTRSKRPKIISLQKQRPLKLLRSRPGSEAVLWD